MNGIKTTGNERIDTATAELALALRLSKPDKRDQDYYDEAMRLRDEMMTGTLKTGAAASREIQGEFDKLAYIGNVNGMGQEWLDRMAELATKVRGALGQ